MCHQSAVMSHAGMMAGFKVACDECTIQPHLKSPPMELPLSQTHSVLSDPNMPLFSPIFSLCSEIRESQAFVCELEGRVMLQFHLCSSLSLSPSVVSVLACTTSHECEEKLCLAEQKASCLLLAPLLTAAYKRGITPQVQVVFLSSVLQRLK